MNKDLKSKIGLEIHAYLFTNEKLFCRCKCIHGSKLSKANTNVCPICTGQPGSKPMLPNKEAIKKINQIALILNCRINEKIIWQRKHYSWPDLPKGFQNTLSGPHATTNAQNGNFLGIKIKEIHLEEDPAAWNPLTGEVDYNRSGSPLVEIVTEPDFSSSEQVVGWLKQLIATLSYMKVLDRNAGIKADVNVSLPELKTCRVEIKNINSLTNIKNAIDSEVKRQFEHPDECRKQETRMFDESSGKTKLMRSKEQAEDYRFISEPDLPAIFLKKTEIEKIKKSLPETPQEKLKKLIKKHKMRPYDAQVLTKNLDLVEFFEKVTEKININLAVPWVTIELSRVLNYNKKSLDDEDVEINVEHFIELLELVQNRIITELKAKEILNKFVPKSFSPKEITMNISKISNSDEIERICNKVINENPKAVADFKAGKQESLNFLVGQVMRLSNKRADFKKATGILKDKLI